MVTIGSSSGNNNSNRNSDQGRDEDEGESSKRTSWLIILIIIGVVLIVFIGCLIFRCYVNSKVKNNQQHYNQERNHLMIQNRQQAILLATPANGEISGPPLPGL
jgi:flagellar basal body-associated protein FliL